MSEQLAPLSKGAERFLENLFAEYRNMSDAQKKSNRDEYAIFFNIGFINGCYYDFAQIRTCADELVKGGYLDSFSRPGYETAYAVFTPAGVEYCQKMFSE